MNQELTENDERVDDAKVRERSGARGGERLWTPLFALIVAMTLCTFMVGQGLNSGTSVYLAHAGEGAAFAGVLAAVFSIAAAVTRIVCGPLIDKRGRYQAMCVGMMLLAVGTVAPALVNNPVMFVACRVVQGIGFSAATTASATAAADVLPLSRLGEGIGYYGLGQALAMSIGPALALFLVSTDPAENLYFGLTAICVTGLVFTLFCRYEHNPARLPATSAYRRKWEARRAAEVAGMTGELEAAQTADNPAPGQKPAARSAGDEPSLSGWRSVLEPRALPGALPMLVLSPAFGFGIFFVGLYGTSLGISNPGLFYTLSAVSMIVVRLNSKSFMDRVAPIKVFAASTVCGVGAFALLLFAGAGGSGSGDMPFYLGGILYGVCLGISSPLNQSVAVKNTPPARWGATNALFLLATDLGIGMSSLVWGLVNDSFGFGATILCVITCILAAFLVSCITYPRER
ncbi:MULTISPECIES: MFS transporter [Gordonibacter]|uniref:MFS transporter n=1 Tax=Gordonibacter faecis TaxID=3047475 RepID=A0ABT7DLJ3_9ACTN|nr:MULTISPECIES: MFS transporter [unclassified Gordonibacter]MDJ1650409.1 MFS transporter [Gordonibacter sp. KGMB12511]HIW76746.1 MFS transporter [Candidatus Gordonibacter avicola]